MRVCRLWALAVGTGRPTTCGNMLMISERIVTRPVQVIRRWNFDARRCARDERVGELLIAVASYTRMYTIPEDSLKLSAGCAGVFDLTGCAKRTSAL